MGSSPAPEDMGAIDHDELGTDISVVVPVYNRSQQLRCLLLALSRQVLPASSFEVLVCDDCSSEDLLPIITEISQQTGLRVLRKRLATRQGAGAARNLGLSNAKGEIVAFTDSDCEPASTWLTALSDAFKDESVGLVGGRIDFRGAEYLSARCVNFLMSSMLGAAGARDPRSPIHMEFYPRTGNLAVRGKMALSIGGFGGSEHGEDLEFSHRLRERGTHVRFLPDAVVLHNEKRQASAFIRDAFRKGRARVRLARDYSLHEWLHAIPAALALYLGGTAVLFAFDVRMASVAAIPGLLYLIVLGLLGIQGAIALREARAAFAVPFFALGMHLAYGVGYIAAWLGLMVRVFSGRFSTRVAPHRG